MENLKLIYKYLIIGCCILSGIIVLIMPRKIIRFFQSVCYFLNWRVEPVSLKKELFYLRILAIALFVLAFMFELALR